MTIGELVGFNWLLVLGWRLGRLQLQLRGCLANVKIATAMLSG